MLSNSDNKARNENSWGEPVGISTGRVSPFLLQAPENGCIAALWAGSDTPVMVVAVDRPSVIDLHVLGTGSIDVALNHEQTVAFLIWMFQSSGHSLTLDAPLHVGLEACTEFPGLSVAELPSNETRPLVVVVQDEKGIVQRIRLIAMPRLILERLAPLIRRQLAERDRHDLQHDYDKAIKRFLRRYRDPGCAFAAATIKAVVA